MGINIQTVGRFLPTPSVLPHSGGLSVVWAQEGGEEAMAVLMYPTPDLRPLKWQSVAN